MKKSAIAAIIVVAAGLAVAAPFVATALKKDPAPDFQTASVDRGSIVAKVTATGTLSPVMTVQVGSQVSGRLQDISVDFNSRVRKGQILARLDPQLVQAALQREKANHLVAGATLKKAQIEAALARRQLDRARELAVRQLMAPADLETAQTKHDMAQAQTVSATAALNQAAASLHQAEVNLSYTTITSPVDGVVISRNVDVGQTVAASLQAPTLFLIAKDLGRMQVNAAVAEADIGKLAPGLPADFTVDAYPGETFPGKVRQIRNSPQTVQNVVTYDAIIDVANPALKLKPGMTANVTFTYAQRPDALRVPNVVLRFRMPGGWSANASRSAEGLGDRAGRGQGRRSGQGFGRSEGSGDGSGEGSGGERRRRRIEGQAVDLAGGPAASEDATRSFRPRRKRMEPGPMVKTVWVMRDRGPRPVDIRVGLSDGTMTEVVEGPLAEGDRLVTGAGAASGAQQRQSGNTGNRRRGGRGLF